MKIRKGLMIMAALGLFVSLCGCAFGFGEKGDNGLGKKAKTNESGISSFSYDYNGSIGANSYHYEVTRTDDGKAEIEYDAMEYDSLGEMTMTVQTDLLDQLDELYRKHNVARWDGYSKYNPNVLDGDGFSLSISFNDGKSMSAHGSNAEPDGYREFISELKAIIDPYLEQMRQAAIQQKIDEGMQGELTFLMANFMQRGNSGSDSYEILLRQNSGNRENVDIRIKSVSGEFIEPGKYNYYAFVDDEDIDFSAIQALIEKYEIIKWYDYDKSAEDYNNEEWFQVSFGFENDSINAMGTMHPENYEEFRQEFLQHIVRIIRNAEDKYEDFKNRESN
ncbi:MAG: hypothetical protein IJI05_02550 [Erysipelotrichaceae bacterium]|nr:hypothetical protein [Erysipelotrichaceae bacterium]